MIQGTRLSGQDVDDKDPKAQGDIEDALKCRHLRQNQKWIPYSVAKATTTSHSPHIYVIFPALAKKSYRW